MHEIEYFVCWMTEYKIEYSDLHGVNAFACFSFFIFICCRQKLTLRAHAACMKFICSCYMWITSEILFLFCAQVVNFNYKLWKVYLTAARIIMITFHCDTRVNPRLLYIFYSKYSLIGQYFEFSLSFLCTHECWKRWFNEKKKIMQHSIKWNH